MGLLSGRRRSADVVAIDYSQFLMLTVEDFDAFVAKRPHLRERLDRIAQARADSNPGHELAGRGQHAAIQGSSDPRAPV